MKATIARAGIVLVAVTALAAARPAPQAAPRPPATPYPCALPSTSPGTPIRLLPVDDAASQPAFFTFRARLQAAIARRDEAAVLAAADPGIRTRSVPTMVSTRSAPRCASRRATIWADLGAVLALGGAFRSPASFEAPYVFARVARRPRLVRVRRGDRRSRARAGLGRGRLGRSRECQLRHRATCCRSSEHERRARADRQWPHRFHRRAVRPQPGGSPGDLPARGRAVAVDRVRGR